MSSLFSDLLVIDCASFIAGPAAATILSDFGARVIKIEPPGIGDSYRNLFRLRGTPDGASTISGRWTRAQQGEPGARLRSARKAEAVLETLIKKADIFMCSELPLPCPGAAGASGRRPAASERAADLRLADALRRARAGARPHQFPTTTALVGPERDPMDMVRATGDHQSRPSPSHGMGRSRDRCMAIVRRHRHRPLSTPKETAAQGRRGDHTSLMANRLWSNSCQVQAALCGYEMVQRAWRGANAAATTRVYRSRRRP